MTNHAALIARLCEASEGSAELSVAVYRAITGDASYEVGGRDGPECGRLVMNSAGHRWWTPAPCLTTDLSAAWEEAKRKGYMPLLEMLTDGFLVTLWDADVDIVADVNGKHEACTLCAAILAAEGER
jgi:hypothetical protein